MADETSKNVSSQEVAEPFGFTLAAFDPTKIKKPSAFVALPEASLRVGQIALTWAAYECGVDDLLKALTQANATPLPSLWEMWPFKRRRKHLAKASKRLFVHHPSIRSYLRSILLDSVDRNILVHGKVWIKVTTGEAVDGKIPGTISLVCHGTHKGKPLSKTFTYDDLEMLFYDLAHLCGRLKTFHENSDTLPFSPSDRSFLKVCLDKYFQQSGPEPERQ